MDSKAFLENYKKIYEEYIAFIETGINKNVLKADEIVNDYVNDLAVGNYSLKSYKAKIIRNEQEHLQNVDDINESTDICLNNLYELFDYYFKEYKVKASNSYVYRERDLKNILLDIKKEKQEVQIRRTNQEKDIQLKEKEFDNSIEELKNLYNGKLDAIKEKLYNDLADNKDDYMHSYLEDEIKLLNVDEKPLIKEIKKTINEKRIKGLEKEFEFKHSACENLEVVEIEFNDKLEAAYIEYNEQLFDKYKLVNSYDLKLEELNLNIKEKEELYEEDYIININNKMLEYQNKFTEFCLLHSNEINKAKEDTINNKLLVFNISLMYYYNIICKLIKNDHYDEFIVIIENIINEIESNMKKYVSLFDKLSKDEISKKALLKSKVEVVYDRQGKDLFIQNVITSLGRFYSNLYKQIDLFYLSYAKTCTILAFDIINRYNKLSSVKISDIKNEYLLTKVDYSLFDLSYMNFNNDISDNVEFEKLKEIIKQNCENFNNSNIEYNKSILEIRNNKKSIIENNYKLKLQTIRNSYKNIEDEIDLDLDKKKESINKEYKVKLNNIKKNTRNRISNAQKLLNESKKYLA